MKKFVCTLNMRLTYFLRTICLVVILTTYCSGLLSAKVIYVNSKATGNNDGTSWTNAYTNLQSALHAVSPGDSIWVAQGTYFPTLSTDRSISFQIPDGVKVFGGFAGDETNFNSRDYKNNVTILSGNIGTTINDDSYHVIYFLNTGSSTALDGFTIKGGQANATQTDTLNIDGIGGGILIGSNNSHTCSPTIDNCLINYNYAISGAGVGIYCETGGNSSPTLNQCGINDNGSSQQNYSSSVTEFGAAGGGGIGVILVSSGTTSLNLSNCTINKDTSILGGGIAILENSNYNTKVTGTIKNCVISNNLGIILGGGILNLAAGNLSTVIINMKIDSCTISDNKSNSGGGVLNFNAGNSQCIPVFTNCKITGNSASILFKSIIIPGFGGGISNIGSGPGPTFTNCTISGDSAISGGGIFNLFVAANVIGQKLIYTPTFTDCRISGNYASNNGGGIFSWSPVDTLSVSLTNSIIDGNYSDSLGGGIYNIADSSGSIFPNSTNNSSVIANSSLMNCTITGNHAGLQGGAMYNQGSNVGVCNTTVKNSIIWDNETNNSTTSIDASTADSLALSAFSYSIVANSRDNSGAWITSLGTDDGHNIDQDPLFKSALDPSTAPSTNGDFHLQSSSPALGAGSPTTDPGVPKTDIDGNPRPLPSTDTHVDIGAYEESNNATNVKDNALQVPKKFMLEQNYPNPFNPSTTIKYDIPKAAHVSLKVYDILGNVVETLVDKDQAAGSYQVQFAISSSQSEVSPKADRQPAYGTGRLASGVYLYNLQAGSYIQSKKMVFLK